MTTIKLLRPVGDDRYEALVVRANVVTGSTGSVDFEEVLLEPVGVLRVLVRARKDLDRRWYAEVFGQVYKVAGVRALPPRGLWAELQLEAEDVDLDIAVGVTLNGENLSMDGERIVL